MIGALWTGISGLASHQKALDNESHNIANVNTVGYKASRISFADQMYQDRIGKGSKILDAEKLYVQGNLKVTGVSFDMALSGQGFFAVSNTRGSGTAETYYTRAGNFRMGDNGTLQDAGGNEVQGWAMSSIDPDEDVVSSNPNVSVFTQDYTKLISSKIVQHSNYVETITAKATDYTQTAEADSETIFSGAGLKSQSGKVADVEELIKDYSYWLQKMKENPDGASATSVAQVSYLDLPNSTAGSAVASEGDQVYVYINGDKYSQTFDTDYATTMKKFADKISTIPGIKAYVAEDTNYTASTASADIANGAIRIESIIPGQQFTVTETGMVSSGTTTQGSYGNLVDSISGSGAGALNSSMEALEKAITGKQEDVYTLEDDLGTLDGFKDLTYQISIYDKDLKQSVTVPGTALTITNPADIDAVVTAINGNSELASYVEAKNINGNLVVKTLDANFDVEFTGSMIMNQFPSYETGSDGVNTPVHTFSSTIKPTPDGAKDYLFTYSGTGLATDDQSITITNPADIDAIVTAINGSAEGLAGDIVASKNTNGELVITAGAVITDFVTSLTETSVPTTDYNVKANANYSTREGANAEFIQIINTIDQTASQGSLQLRLDTLNISDSAFGEFSVDSTGLITMKQDGADFAIGQVAIALFSNERGLEPTGDNLLKKTTDSGDPIYNTNNNKTAKIEGNTLELSTADLSESLVNLMVFQRAFEANAKSITTSDELLNTLINLKR
jgi:flagellar hook protein FlgE